VRALVGYLFDLAGLPVDLDALLVTPMEDGGLGSLAIALLRRNFGSAIAECCFQDSGAAPVSAVMVGPTT
jgi:hypothetical protein